MNRILLMLLVVAGCASSSPSGTKAGVDSSLAVQAAPPAPAGAASPKMKVASTAGTTASLTRRLIVYTGTVSLAVASLDATVERLQKYAEQQGGYVVVASRQSVVFRVPASKFKQAMAFAKGLGDVLDYSVTAEDVTKRYRDLELRLKNALAERDKLMELLGKAQDVKDVLAIRKELRRLTEEIERMKAELAGLKESIAYSTITVNMQERAKMVVLRPLAGPLSWLNHIGLNTLLEGGE